MTHIVFVRLLFSCWLFVPAISTTRGTTDFSTGDQDVGGDDMYSGSGSGDFLPVDFTSSTVSVLTSEVVATSEVTTAEVHEAQSTTVMMEDLTASSTSKTIVNESLVQPHGAAASGDQPPTNEHTTLKVDTTSSSPEVKTSTAPKEGRRPVVHAHTAKADTSISTTVPVIDDDLPSESSTASVIPADEGSGMDMQSTSGDLYFASSDATSATVAEKHFKFNVKDANMAEDTGSKDAVTGSTDNKGVLGAVIGGGVVGLLVAMSLLGLMLYRMKKKDEGSYSLEEPKQSNGGYQKPQRQEEFYA